MKKRFTFVILLIVLRLLSMQAQTYDVELYIPKHKNDTDVKIQQANELQQALIELGYDNFVKWDEEQHGIVTSDAIGLLFEINTENDSSPTYGVLIRYPKTIPSDVVSLKPQVYTHFPSNALGGGIFTFQNIDSIDLLAFKIHLVIQYLLNNCEPILNNINQNELANLREEASFFAFVRGNCSLAKNEYQTAIYYFGLSLDYQGDYNPRKAIPATHHLAMTYALAGYDEHAIEIMNLLIDQSKQDGWSEPHTLTHRADIYAFIFDYTSAVQDMDDAIALMDSDYHYQLARAYKQRGDIIMLIYEWNRALEDYNTAIELDPDYAEAYYRRGILLYTMVERENAVTDFNVYLELNPDGQFAESASEYIDNIQGELDALGG